MTRKFLLLLVFFSCLIYSCKHTGRLNPENDPDYENIIKPTSFFPEEFNEQGRIYYYTKIFGLLKYCSDNDHNKNINHRFIQNYDAIKNASDKKSFNQIICRDFLLSVLDDNNEMDIDWLHDTNYFEEETITIINSICSYFIKDKNTYLTQDNIGIITINDHDKPGDFDVLFPSEATRIWGLANYWNYINYFWAYKPLMDINWDIVLFSHIPNFISANNAQEYNIAVLKFTSNTDDNHCSVKSDVVDNEILGIYAPNFTIKKIDTTFIVNKLQTTRDRFPSDTIIKPGDILLAVNGVKIDDLYNSIKDCFAASNSWTKSRNVNRYILHSLKEKNLITYSRNNITDSVKLIYSIYSDYKTYNDSISKTKQKVMPVSKTDQTCYVHIYDLYLENYKSALKELHKAQNIIIDMRGYPNGLVAFRLMNHLLPAKTDFFRTIYPDINTRGLLKSKKGYEVGGSRAYLNKRIIVLVNEQTQSQAEFFVMALQQMENVTVVGSYTSGADGNVTFLQFPGQITSRISGIGVLYPDSTITQRVGIKVDHIVEPTIEDYKNNRDAILEYAYMILE